MLRILSLLPAATEIVCLLGLEKYLIGTSYSIHLDTNMLKKLKPNLILTQELCQVCAVGFSEVKKATRVLSGETKIISLEPQSIEDILENIILIGESSGKSLESRKIVKSLKKRLKILDSRLSILATNKPKVCVVEWFDPLMVAGHWIPEMVGFAGGVNVISEPGKRSKIITLHHIIASKPDILIISPCGFDIKRIIKEKLKIKNLKLKIKTPKVFLVDGNAYMTRPGPRIVDGIEILAEILHPEIFPRRYTKKDWVEL